jgi:hypothetical protein
MRRVGAFCYCASTVVKRILVDVGEAALALMLQLL